MAERLGSWEDVVAFALTLPDTQAGTYFGGPAVKVARNGRAFLTPGREADVSFCLMIDRDTIEMLKATDPDTYYQPPHYVGWEALLVRYGSADPERVRATVAAGHAYAAAKKPAAARKKTR